MGDTYINGRELKFKVEIGEGESKIIKMIGK
jgi:hypothetical protein